jgi:hypothetical protein
MFADFELWQLGVAVVVYIALPIIAGIALFIALFRKIKGDKKKRKS